MSDLWKQFERQTEKYSGCVPSATFDYSINISLKYNYLYTETPKVACSTVKSILQKMELEDPDFHREDFEDIHDRQFSPLLKPSQVGDFERLLNSGIFKFCFARNPYSRLLSSYLEKICGNKPPKLQILKHLGKNPSNIAEDISFDQFVNVVCELPLSIMNPHWRVQYDQTFQQSIEYDFIGKSEAFPSDLHYVLGKLNSNYTQYLTDERRHAKKSGTRLLDFYTPSLAKMVQAKFRKDFEFFGYDEDLEYASKPIQASRKTVAD